MAISNRKRELHCIRNQLLHSCCIRRGIASRGEGFGDGR